jgi:hypothetical protein
MEEEREATYRAKRTTEEQDVWLRSVARVVLPSTTLLHTNATPFRLRKGAVLGQVLGHLLGQDHVTVFEFTILIFLAVINLLGLI